MQVARLRTAPACAVTTCMLTPSFCAVHAAGIADAAAAVDGESDRDRVDHRAVGRLLERVALIEHAAHVAVADLAAVERDVVLDEARGVEPAGEIDHHLGQRLARPSARRRAPRRRIDWLGRVDVDDDAVLDAARHLMADADDLRLAAVVARR